MTAESEQGRAVLVRVVEKYSASAVAGILGRRAKVPALDFAVALRRSWGIVAESLPADEADALALDLTRAGQTAVSAPASLLENLPVPIQVARADLSAEGFDLLSGPKNAAAQRAPWSQLAAVCAGAIETKTTTTISEAGAPADSAKRVMRLGLMMVTGVPMMGGKTEKKRAVSRTDRDLTLDLLFIEPFRRLRVVARAFNFDVLGPKMAPTADVNFAIFMRDLVARAPNALRGKGTRAVLSGRMGDAFYEFLAELEGEERWLMNLAVLRAAL